MESVREPFVVIFNSLLKVTLACAKTPSNFHFNGGLQNAYKQSRSQIGLLKCFVRFHEKIVGKEFYGKINTNLSLRHLQTKIKVESAFGHAKRNILGALLAKIFILSKRTGQYFFFTFFHDLFSNPRQLFFLQPNKKNENRARVIIVRKENLLFYLWPELQNFLT